MLPFIIILAALVLLDAPATPGGLRLAEPPAPPPPPGPQDPRNAINANRIDRG